MIPHSPDYLDDDNSERIYRDNRFTFLFIFGIYGSVIQTLLFAFVYIYGHKIFQDGTGGSPSPVLELWSSPDSIGVGKSFNNNNNNNSIVENSSSEFNNNNLPNISLSNSLSWPKTKPNFPQRALLQLQFLPIVNGTWHVPKFSKENKDNVNQLQKRQNSNWTNPTSLNLNKKSAQLSILNKKYNISLVEELSNNNTNNNNNKNNNDIHDYNGFSQISVFQTFTLPWSMQKVQNRGAILFYYKAICTAPLKRYDMPTLERAFNLKSFSTGTCTDDKYMPICGKTTSLNQTIEQSKNSITYEKEMKEYNEVNEDFEGKKWATDRINSGDSNFNIIKNNYFMGLELDVDYDQIECYEIPSKKKKQDKNSSSSSKSLQHGISRHYNSIMVPNTSGIMPINTSNNNYNTTTTADDNDEEDNGGSGEDAQDKIADLITILGGLEMLGQICPEIKSGLEDKFNDIVEASNEDISKTGGVDPQSWIRTRSSSRNGLFNDKFQYIRNAHSYSLVITCLSLLYGLITLLLEVFLTVIIPVRRQVKRDEALRRAIQPMVSVANALSSQYRSTPGLLDGTVNTNNNSNNSNNNNSNNNDGRSRNPNETELFEIYQDGQHQQQQRRTTTEIEENDLPNFAKSLLWGIKLSSGILMLLLFVWVLILGIRLQGSTFSQAANLIGWEKNEAGNVRYSSAYLEKSFGEFKALKWEDLSNELITTTTTNNNNQKSSSSSNNGDGDGNNELLLFQMASHVLEAVTQSKCLMRYGVLPVSSSNSLESYYTFYTFLLATSSIFTIFISWGFSFYSSNLRKVLGYNINNNNNNNNEN